MGNRKPVLFFDNDVKATNFFGSSVFQGHAFTAFSDRTAFLDALKKHPADQLALVVVRLKEFSIELIEKLSKLYGHLKFMVLTHTDSADFATDHLRNKYVNVQVNLEPTNPSAYQQKVALAAHAMGFQ